MVVNKAYKIRLYPNKSQLNMIEQSFGCSRFIYNSMLAERKSIYELHKDDENRQALWTHKYKTEKDYKQEFTWLKDVESSSLQQARIDLSRAYTNFFNSLSGKSKGKSQFPKFHKKGVKESYRVVVNNNNIKYEDFDDAVRARLIGEYKYFGEFAPQKHLWGKYGLTEGDVKNATKE